jgi:insecticidal toxin complex protein TccC
MASADPAGDVDGPNRFAFVGNNPLRYVDPDGNNKAESVIMLYSAFLSSVQGHSTQVAGQIHNILHEEGVAMNLALNMAGEVVRGVVGYEGGVAGGKQVDLIMPNMLRHHAYTTTGGDRRQYWRRLCHGHDRSDSQQRWSQNGPTDSANLADLGQGH